MTTLTDKIATRYLDRLFSSAQGRAFFLSSAADAEDSDEVQFFERLRAHVEDAQLQTMIGRHEEDETRHAQLFRAAVRRQGFEPTVIPEHLKLLARVDEAVGGIFDVPITSDRGVMDAYLMLQVIEERALTQFRMFEPIMRTYDAESADLLLEIARDEERHLKYCVAISRQYAPDEEARLQRLQHFRDVEARAFAENTAAHMLYVLDHGLLAASRFEQTGWRMFARVAGRREDRTPFWDSERAGGADTGGHGWRPSVQTAAAVVAHSPHAPLAALPVTHKSY